MVVISRFKFCAAETDVVFLYAQGINSGFVNNRFNTAFSAKWAAWFVSAIIRWCFIVIACGCLRALCQRRLSLTSNCIFDFILVKF